ncbi:MAG: BamA/TamA family outer membrane protein [Ferruginibacter sp.]
MKVAISARLFAKWNMNINTSQWIVGLDLVFLNNYCMKTGTNQMKSLLVILLYCSLSAPLLAQKISVVPQNTYLDIKFIDKDSSFHLQGIPLQTVFASQADAYNFLGKLSALLTAKGYPVASIDSAWSSDSTVHAHVYIGTHYNWVQLTPVNIDKAALEEAGFMQKNFANKALNIAQLQLLQQRILNYFEKEGHPFATIYLDSVSITDDKINALLKADKGILYPVDSIRVYGKVSLSKKFLQHYLDISNGSSYNKEKLALVDKRIQELQYVSTLQPSDVTMLGAGSVLNLYLQPKRSSQINFLIGFLPASGESGKLQLTGDVNLDLKNLLGTGENILIKWQQLQKKSPRLNLGYNQPYIFNTKFGFDFLFDLFKKDSSFLQINAQFGLEYGLAINQIGKFFVQWQNTSLLSGAVDTNLIKAKRKLPANIDVNSVNVGINYSWINTNYRYNPRKGNEINIVASVGIKKVKQNADITSIKDPLFNYASLYDSIKPKSYQLRLKLAAAHYIPLGKLSVFKTAINTGLYSSPSIFRNELFQVGGYKLLRGFDEESIYASQYGVVTLEYRNLIDVASSYLFFFIDAGLTKSKYQSINVNNQFLGAGFGIVYETKLGALNLSYAVGKRDDIKFNIREASKLHFGYINFF